MSEVNLAGLGCIWSWIICDIEGLIFSDLCGLHNILKCLYAF